MSVVAAAPEAAAAWEDKRSGLGEAFGVRGVRRLEMGPAVTFWCTQVDVGPGRFNRIHSLDLSWFWCVAVTPWVVLSPSSTSPLPIGHEPLESQRRFHSHILF